MFKKIIKEAVLVRSHQSNNTVYVFLCIYICMERERQRDVVVQVRFVTRNWLMRLWRLTNLKLCRVSQQAGDPEDLIV